MTEIVTTLKPKPINSSIFKDCRDCQEYPLGREERLPSRISTIRGSGNNNFFGSEFSFQK